MKRYQAGERVSGLEELKSLREVGLVGSKRNIRHRNFGYVAGGCVSYGALGRTTER